MNKAHEKPIKILFVCLANLCRSPMAKAIAEAVYGGMIEAESAGIMPATGPPFPETVIILREHYGADISAHKPRHVLEYPIADFDYIIALDTPVFIRLNEMKEIPREKLYGWEIADPCGLGMESYERTALRIEDELERFVHRVETERKRR